MNELENHELWEVYDSWHEGNRDKILKGVWNLVPSKVLENPQSDLLRGLNLIAFLDSETNKEIDDLFVDNRLKEVVGNAEWFIPSNGRHVTILDIIPHNSGKSEAEIKSEAPKYIELVDRVLNSRKFNLKIVFSGIFASPDGITLQGFPIGDVQLLRDELRKDLSMSGLINLEKNKYVINTAHVALVKFIEPLDGTRLLEVVDQMRRTSEILFEMNNLVLNISSRYDKIKTIEVVKTWKI